MANPAPPKTKKRYFDKKNPNSEKQKKLPFCITVKEEHLIFSGPGFSTVCLLFLCVVVAK